MIEIILDKLSGYFADVNVTTIVIVAIALILFFGRYIIKNWSGIRKIYDYFMNKKKAEEETRAQIKKLLDMTKEFDDKLNKVSQKVDQDGVRLENLERQTHENTMHISTYEENRIHDREQSFNKQHIIDEHFDELKNILKDVQANVVSMQKKADIQECANLKDRISRLYRECKDEKKWTKMQKDTMEDMIKSYELSPNGKNSFVHSVVQSEMYTWEIIDEDE